MKDKGGRLLGFSSGDGHGVGGVRWPGGPGAALHGRRGPPAPPRQGAPTHRARGRRRPRRRARRHPQILMARPRLLPEWDAGPGPRLLRGLQAREPPVDGITDTNPEGLTAAFGAWAPAVAACLQNGGLTCKVLEKGAFKKQMLEKLIWISAFMVHACWSSASEGYRWHGRKRIPIQGIQPHS